MPRPPANLKHGAHARRHMLLGESHEAFAALHARLVARFGPEGPLETSAVESLASLLWWKKTLAPTAKPAGGSHAGESEKVRGLEDRFWSLVERQILHIETIQRMVRGKTRTSVVVTLH